MTDESTPSNKMNQTTTNKPEAAQQKESTEQPDYPTPPHESHVTEDGEPDYEATINAIGLEYDKVYRIGNDLYRYRGHRTDDIVLVPLSEYCELDDDCLRLEDVWKEHLDGKIEEVGAEDGQGMIANVENKPATSKIQIQPGPSQDSLVYFDLEGVPQLAGFYVDYYHGEDRPMVYFYDADKEEVALEILPPNTHNDENRIIRDQAGYNVENMPETIWENIMGDN